MNELVLRISTDSVTDDCALCGRNHAAEPGPQFVLADGNRLVCGDCGLKNAPSLAALSNLADEAARVGKIGRHTVFPPYTALLDLARAADQYSSKVMPE
jgi:hypothetical protein